MKESLVRFTAIIKGWCLSQFPHTDEGNAAREQWVFGLSQPLPGETMAIEASREDVQADADLFLAAMKG